MNAHPPYSPGSFDDEEYLRDFKRREPILSRLSRERWLNAARNVRFIGRRSWSHFMLRLKRPRQGEK